MANMKASTLCIALKKHVGDGYVYGAVGVECTTALLKSKEKQYGKSMGAGYYSKDGDYTKGKCGKWLGMWVADCSGLIRACRRDNGFGDVSGSAQGVYDQCKKDRGSDMSKMPKIPGVCVFKYSKSKGRMGHVGVYVGGGYTIESAGVNDGVIYRKLSSSWDHWGKLDWLDYNLDKDEDATKDTKAGGGGKYGSSNGKVNDDTAGSSGDNSGSDSGDSEYEDLTSWSAEYLQTNFPKIINQIIGAGAPPEIEAAAKEVFVSTYLTWSKQYNIGDPDAKTSDSKDEKIDQSIVDQCLSTLEKNMSGSKITVPLKYLISLPFAVANKNLVLYFKDSKNISDKLQAITNFSKISFNSLAENKFNPTFIQLLYEVHAKLTTTIEYFIKQQKITIVRGFVLASKNDKTKDDKLEYSPHSAGLAADIYIVDYNTYAVAAGMLTQLNIPNISYNSDNQTMHIDISPKR